MTTELLTVFLGQGNPCANRLFSYISASDGARLLRVCRAMRESGYISFFSDDNVEKLATAILNTKKLEHFSPQRLPESYRKNRYFIERVVRRNGLFYLALEDCLKSNTVILKTAVVAIRIQQPKKLPMLLRSIPEALRTRPDISAIINERIIFGSEDIWREYGIGSLIVNGTFPAPTRTVVPWLSDKDIVASAVRINGMILQYLGHRFQEDPEIVQIAVESTGWAILSATNAMSLNRDIVTAAVHQNGFVLRCLYAFFQNDPEIVHVAVTSCGVALEFASKELRANKNIVASAVKQNGMALKFASAELQNDLDIVKMAIASCREAIKYASEALRAGPCFRELVQVRS